MNKLKCLIGILGIITTVSSPLTAMAADSNSANDPTTPKWTYIGESWYTPTSYGKGSHTSYQQYDRFMIPFTIADQGFLARFNIGWANISKSEGGRTTDFGDSTSQIWALFNKKFSDSFAMTFGIGPAFTAPTGAGAETTHKWQFGPSSVMILKYDWGIAGGILTYNHSISSGPFNTPHASDLSFQPLIFYNLEDNWYLRSSATSVFNFKTGSYYIPIGLGAGHVFDMEDKSVLNVYAEVQPTVAHKGSEPAIILFAAVKYQFGGPDLGKIAMSSLNEVFAHH